MTRPRLALLNAAHDPDATSRNFRRELAADLVEFHLPGGERAPPVAELDVDGVVVTGSRSSVYDDDDWIRWAHDWVGEALDADLPALGICWGHQLLASVLGGTVEDMGEYELGYRTVTHHGTGLYDGVPEEFLVFTTHSDAVTELPPGAELTAENDYGVHGFRTGTVFGVQSHPEYDAETARSVAAGKDVDPGRKERVLDAVTEANYDRAKAAKQVFDNFLAVVDERRGARDEPAAAE